jgi:DNA-binding XRE family transcriptional regulator
MIIRGMTNRRGTDTKTMEAIGARIAEAWEKSKHSHLNQGDIGKKLGVRGQAVSLWVRGERLPGTQNCIELAALFDVCLDWMLLGKGTMRPNNVKGEAVYIDGWPSDAKSVVKGMAAVYDVQKNKAK